MILMTYNICNSIIVPAISTKMWRHCLNSIKLLDHFSHSLSFLNIITSSYHHSYVACLVYIYNLFSEMVVVHP